MMPIILTMVTRHSRCCDSEQLPAYAATLNSSASQVDDVNQTHTSSINFADAMTNIAGTHQAQKANGRTSTSCTILYQYVFVPLRCSTLTNVFYRLIDVTDTLAMTALNRLIHMGSSELVRRTYCSPTTFHG